MRRIFPLLAALIVVLATGLVHGLWTERWHTSLELVRAVERLKRFPETIGAWKAKPAHEDTDALERAGAAGWRVRRFTHPKNGSFLVILMCGRPGPMSVHRPEHCYRGAGYEMLSPPVHATLPARGNAPAPEFWSGRFVRQDETRTVRLRIVWTWLDDRRWQAPRTPRLSFARLPALYKLYVIREASGSDDRVEESKTKEFLELLLPELTKALSPS